MKTKLLLLGFLIAVQSSLYSYSTDDLATTAITDINFELALIDLGIDSDGTVNGQVLTSDINTITSLDLSDPLNNTNFPNVTGKISDLTGIEGFVALETLSINDNLVSSIDLSFNTSLHTFTCVNNALTSLDISSNLLLKTLFLDNNQVSILNVNANTLLETLSFTLNNVSILNVNNNGVLKYLAFGRNQINTLDVSLNTNLETLLCDNNGLTSIDVSSNPNLINLGIQNNQISSLDVSTNTALVQLYCSFNQLTSLNIANGNNVNFTFFQSQNNPNLTCITADAATPATGYTTNWYKDVTHMFSANCFSLSCTADTNTTIQNTTLTVSATNGLLANDTGGTLSVIDFVVNGTTISAGNTANLSEGDITINGDGSYTFIPATNYSGVVPQISYALTDGTSTVRCTLDITVTSVNSVPVCNSDIATTLEDTVLTVNAANGLLANDTDADGDSLVITDISVLGTTFTLGAQFGATGMGTITIFANGSYNFTPDQDFNGNFFPVDYTISDGNGGTSTCTFNLTVTPVNDAPIAVDDLITGNSGSVITTNDTDVDGTVDATTIILIDPSNITNTGNVTSPLIVAGIGTFTIDASGNIIFLADAGFTGTTSAVNYTVNDDVGLTSNTATITFNLSSCAITLIPDTNFENQLVVQNIDSDGLVNGQVCTSDINTITTLDVNNKGIVDLTGIEDFIALEDLKCFSNSISSVDLSSNINLKSLKISQNQLVGINLSNNINLETLNLNGNQLTAIDLSQNLLLKDFYVSNNQLSNLVLTNNSLLTSLIFSNNQITTIDLSSNTLLELVHGHYNQLNTINVNALLNLKQLLVHYNTTLTSIDVSLNNQLNKLDISKTGITNLDLSNNNSLTHTNLFDSNLETLDIRNGNNSAITFFDARLNPNLTCVAVSDVGYFNTNYGQGSYTIDTQTSYSSDCSAVWIVMTSPATTAALLAVTPSIDTDGTPGISLAEAAAYTGTLDLSNTGITDIAGLLAFSSITTLDISGNGITDISSLTGSGFGVISKTGQIKQVKKSATMGLQNIILSKNNFEVLDLNSFSNLTSLDISNNPDLKTVSFQNGNNGNITSFNSINTPNLSCILVDDVNASYLSSWIKDVKSEFVADATDCRSKVLSLENIDLDTNIVFYPNPVNDILSIKLSEGLNLQEVKVYSLSGKNVMKSNKSTLDFSRLSKGFYLVKIITDKGVSGKRIIKN